MPVLPEPGDEERLEQLPGDEGTPFNPADDSSDDPTLDDAQQAGQLSLDDTHQVTDTELDDHEVYDEGYSGAAEASEPNAGNAVTGYDPEQDQRRQDTPSDKPEDIAL